MVRLAVFEPATYRFVVYRYRARLYDIRWLVANSRAVCQNIEKPGSRCGACFKPQIEWIRETQAGKQAFFGSVSEGIRKPALRPAPITTWSNLNLFKEAHPSNF
jgi:hypothetical protein